MTRTERYILGLVCGFSFILGWNVFLIHRDAKLFDAYYQQKAKVEQQKLIK